MGCSNSTNTHVSETSTKIATTDKHKYKLVYFNGKGRCEHIRYLFAVSGKEYEDKRLEGDEWQGLKPKTPFGTLPILEADGHVIAGSVAIGRFVAKLVNLAGSNYLEQGLVDAIVDVCIDVREVIFAVAQESRKNQDKKFEMPKESQEKLDNYLAKLEQRLGSDKYFVAKKPSYADIQFFASVEPAFELLQQKDFLDKYPKLKSLYQRVSEYPAMKKYRESRPVTGF